MDSKESNLDQTTDWEHDKGMETGVSEGKTGTNGNKWDRPNKQEKLTMKMNMGKLLGRTKCFLEEKNKT
ncbi:hypothetical protein CHS0354_022265 [Potamilus streckersoni]|uniref:Uncharacterized protein n=1 Tax=Potamilus streckersoni TaxID=2493646 RepID=A0AAE0RXV7_9BIVA|nr:hypothetical protein CHS0354_022265 [Potamilus streckersoni]